MWIAYDFFHGPQNLIEDASAKDMTNNGQKAQVIHYLVNLQATRI